MAARMAGLTVDAQSQTLNILTSSPVMLSEAKHLGSEILRFAQNDSFECRGERSAFSAKSGRRFVLLFTNQWKFFALHHRPIDGDFGDIFAAGHIDRKSTRLNSSHDQISYAVFCL